MTGYTPLPSGVDSAGASWQRSVAMPPAPPTRLSKAVARAVADAPCTMRALAAAADVPFSTLSRVVSGERAATVAVALAEHPKIARLVYPGRPDHPQAEIAHRQMRGGSTLVAFEIKGGKAAAFRFQDALKLVRISNNLGDAKSLITHPATTTHQRLTPAARAELGISDGLVRLSCGLEHPDDLVEDVLVALKAA